MFLHDQFTKYNAHQFTRYMVFLENVAVYANTGCSILSFYNYFYYAVNKIT